MRLILLLLLALAASGCDRQKAGDQQGDSSAGAPAVQAKGVDRSHRGRPAPATVFSDPDGEETSIAALGGKPLLVNLWATWCAPCVKELPTLDRLAAARGDTLAVVAVSQDMGPHNSVRAFLDKLGIDRLGAYHDPDMALSSALGAEVLPTSILYDSQGRELWRYVGDLDWTGAEAARLLDEAEAGSGGRG